MLRNQGNVSKIFKTILSQKQRLSWEYGLPNDWQLSAVTVNFSCAFWKFRRFIWCIWIWYGREKQYFSDKLSVFFACEKWKRTVFKTLLRFYAQNASVKELYLLVVKVLVWKLWKTCTTGKSLFVFRLCWIFQKLVFSHNNVQRPGNSVNHVIGCNILS